VGAWVVLCDTRNRVLTDCLHTLPEECRWCLRGGRPHEFTRTRVKHALDGTVVTDERHEWCRGVRPPKLLDGLHRPVAGGVDDQAVYRLPLGSVGVCPPGDGRHPEPIVEPGEPTIADTQHVYR
jgi:hypothetical protein